MLQNLKKFLKEFFQGTSCRINYVIGLSLQEPKLCYPFLNFNLLGFELCDALMKLIASSGAGVGIGGTKLSSGISCLNTLSHSGSKYLASKLKFLYVKFICLSKCFKSSSNELLNGDRKTHVAATPEM